MKTEPHLHSMSIFDSPKVYAVREDGCLELHLGNVTIHIYGEDPYKVAPEIEVVTQEEWTKARTAQIVKRARGVEDEAAPVE